MPTNKVTLDVRLCISRDAEANWEKQNPLLLEGEIAYSTDKGLFKVGDGSSKWSALQYTSSRQALSLAGMTASIADLNQLSGITGNVQTQLNTKASFHVGKTAPTIPSIWFEVTSK